MAQKAEVSKSPETLKDVQKAQDDQTKTKADEETSEEETSEEAPEGKTLYRLNRGFWDGQKLHKRGDELYFATGKAPKGSDEVR